MKKKILIVEDVQLNIDLLVQLLEDDYDLLVAHDGVQGVVTAKRERPDLILMDISLPLMDGHEATRIIRATPFLKTTPLIVISARALHGDIEKAREAGCNEYMTKPVDIDLLYTHIDSYLEPVDIEMPTA